MATKISACGLRGMSFDACGSVLVAEIDACRLTEIDAYGLMLVVEIGDCGGEVI